MTMKKFKLSKFHKILLVATAFLLLIVVFGVNKVGDHVIEIPEATIQQKIDEKLAEAVPEEVQYVSFRITSAQVHLEENRVRVHYTIQAFRRNTPLATLKAEASGDLKYRNGGIYLHQADFQFLHLEAESKILQVGGKVAQAGFRKAVNLMGEKVDLDLSGDMGALEEEALDWLKDAAVTQLERRPIYRIRDSFSGVVIGAALHEDGLQLHPGKLVAHVSFWGAAWGVVAAVVAMILLMASALVFALFVHPRWLLA